MMELVTGGSGSGKSAYAEDRICALYEEYRKTGKKEQKLYYIATMYPYGTETEEKIADHRRRREGKGFRTLEWYTNITEKIHQFEASGEALGCVLLECVSNLAANELYMEEGAKDEAVRVVAQAMAMLKKKSCHLVVVTNEIFSESAKDSGQAAGDDRQNGQAGIAIGLDQHLHVIGDDEAQREGGQTPEIIDGILIRYALCAQQHGERLQKYEDEDSDGQADAGQQHDVLGEQAIGSLALVLSQIDGDDGAGTDGEDDADGEKHIGERHCQIHRRHGVLTDALGHHQPVHNGVQAENHEGCHRSGYEMQKL